MGQESLIHRNVSAFIPFYHEVHVSVFPAEEFHQLLKATFLSTHLKTQNIKAKSTLKSMMMINNKLYFNSPGDREGAVFPLSGDEIIVMRRNDEIR